MAPETETLAGYIARVTFFNEENGFAVLSIQVPGREGKVAAVGRVTAPVAGEFIEMDGRVIVHPQFGPRFAIEQYRRAAPTSPAGLKKYLGSGLIKGLGPVLAGRLVDHFGAAILDILEREPERLIEVPGLGAGRRETIMQAWQKSRGLKRLLQFLAQFGLGPAAAGRILKRLGPEAENLIREDPYRLSYEVEGVGFLTADKVARRLGLAEDAPPRVRAALCYVLRQAALNGQVFLPRQPLLKEGAELLPGVAPTVLEDALAGLVRNGQVKARPRFENPEVEDYYWPPLYRAEKRLVEGFETLLRAPAGLSVPEPEKALVWAEKQLDLELAPGQRQAALAAFTEKVLVITGGPGTGKTTLTRVIMAVFAALAAKIALTAPTGRAAKRLNQATGLTAKTIHRLLEYSPEGFARGPHRKLELDLLLVDETSMVDLRLMSQLAGALPASARLILVGDQDQLPSVGPGRVLADLIESGRFPVARLEEIYRQARFSQIVQAAHSINRGRRPQGSRDRENGDFYFLEEKDPDKIIALMLRIITQRLPQKLGLDQMRDIQVLTPMNQGPLGVEALNSLLAAALNPCPGPSVSRLGRRFKIGDKVIQLHNNYTKEVFNGDAGLVTAIDLEAQELTATFDGRPLVYDLSDLDELNLAYAITIHKSQGSEFPAIVLPLTLAHRIMLRRKLLYTAVTRGRRFVVLIGDPAALDLALASNREQVRYSNLSEGLARLRPVP